MSYTIEQLDCAVDSATRHLRAEVEKLTRELKNEKEMTETNIGRLHDRAMEYMRDRDRFRAEVERLRAALSALFDEQNDAPLERRRKKWEAACQQAREALGR